MFRKAVALNPLRCPSVRDEAAALGLPVLPATGPLVSKVHSQAERYVQHGKSIELTGHVCGRDGSNSNWLRETGAASKIPAFLIAGTRELDLAVLRGAKTIGLTAGASVPEIFVADVIEASSALGSVALTALPGNAEDVEFKLPAGLDV